MNGKRSGVSLFLGILLLLPCMAEASQEEDSMNNTLRMILQRKSVRSFTPQPVSRDTLNTILRAGMAAPSARDRRPWRFVVVTERAVLEALGKGLPFAKMTAQAAAAIVVVGDLEGQNGGRGSDYWIQDCSAVTQNILLAVESLGLGAVWTAVYPNADRIEIVRRVLGIPEGFMPLNVIPLGHPAESPKPKDKWTPDNIRWEKW